MHGKWIWPCRKKVKCQCRIMILAILVDLLALRSCAKLFGSGVEDFKGFYQIWAWRPSWSVDHDHFSNLSFPHPKMVPHKIWATFAQRLQRRSSLKFSTFSHTNLLCPYKCIGKQTWPRRKKSQTLMYDHHFSKFGRSPVPDDLCKNSAPRYPQFWRRRFLKVFTVYGHGSHLGQWTATILGIFRFPNLRRLSMKFE